VADSTGPSLANGSRPPITRGSPMHPPGGAPARAPEATRCYPPATQSTLGVTTDSWPSAPDSRPARVSAARSSARARVPKHLPDRTGR
jgi:hypothetical protein